MHVTCSTTDLAAAVAIVNRSAPGTRSPMVILGNIMLIAEPGKLTMVASNLEHTTRWTVDASVFEEGSVLVPTSLFVPIIEALSGPSTTLTVEKPTKPMTITAGRFKSNIPTLDAIDFPTIRTVAESYPDAVTVTLDTATFRKALGQTVFCCAQDQSRPVLGGVHITITHDQITLEAADAFRLARRVIHTETAGVTDPIEFILPRSAAGELMRLLAETTGTINAVIGSSGNQAQWVFPRGDFLAQLTVGAYPDTSRLIPSQYTTRITAVTGALESATRQCAIMAKDGSGILRMTIDNPEDAEPVSTIHLRASADERGEADSDVDCATIDGTGNKVAVNYRYLLAALAALEGDTVIEITSASLPIVIRSTHKSAQEEYTQVVMPMFVQW